MPIIRRRTRGSNRARLVAMSEKFAGSIPPIQKLPSRRRRKLRWFLTILVVLLVFGGWNWWSYSRFEVRYREALESHLRTNPADAEAWFALATCNASGMSFNPDEQILDKVIALDSRPLFLLTVLGSMSQGKRSHDAASLERLEASAGSNASVWMALAQDRLRRGNVEDCLRSVRKALACQEMGYRKGQGIDIHRRFIRRFFGDGYMADSLILRQEPVDYVLGDLFLWEAREIALEFAGTLWMGGDPEGARTAFETMYRFGVQTENRDMQWYAASHLCELAVDRTAGDVELWKQRAEPVRPRFNGMFCGNVYYADDPWVACNSWPGRIWHDGTIQGSWLPVWYFARRGHFHAIADGLGSPSLPPWRWADRDRDKDLDGKYTGPSAKLEILFQNRDVLSRSITDQETFNRLADLASTSDAVMMWILRSEWKSGPPPSPVEPGVVYIYAKRGAYQGADESVRREVAQILTKARSPVWGPDAWRLSAQIHRDAFLEQTFKSFNDARTPAKLTVLRDVSGQAFGFEYEQWQSWWISQQSQKR